MGCVEVEVKQSLAFFELDHNGVLEERLDCLQGELRKNRVVVLQTHMRDVDLSFLPLGAMLKLLGDFEKASLNFIFNVRLKLLFLVLYFHILILKVL